MQRKYLASLCLSLLENLLYSGIIYGWPFLVEVFKQEGYFSELCHSSDEVIAPTLQPFNATNATALNCLEQTERFNLIYTMASVLNVLFCFIAGLIFDRFGTWVCKGLGTTLYTVGFILLAKSSSLNPNLLYPGMASLALGGSCFFMINFQYANLFKTTRSTWISMYNGLFISSSFVFWMFSSAHEKGVDISLLFMTCIGPLLFLFLLSFVFGPRGQVPYPVPKDFRYGIQVGKSARERKLSLPSKKLSADLRDSGLATSFRPQRVTISSGLGIFLYIMNLFQMSVMSLRNQFFTGTFDSWSQNVGGGDTEGLTVAFGIITAISGFAAPLVGLLDDALTKYYRKHTRDLVLSRIKSSNAFTLFSCICTILLSLCAILPVPSLQYVTFVLLTVSRLVCYSYSYISISTHYPNEQVGKLIGLLWTMGGLLLMLQYPMLRFVLRSCGGDFTTINIVFLVLNVLTLGFPISLYLTHSRVVKIIKGARTDVNGNSMEDNSDLLQHSGRHGRV